jgi:hypothetical protein
LTTLTWGNLSPQNSCEAVLLSTARCSSDRPLGVVSPSFTRRRIVWRNLTIFGSALSGDDDEADGDEDGGNDGDEEGDGRMRQRRSSKRMTMTRKMLSGD